MLSEWQWAEIFLHRGLLQCIIVLQYYAVVCEQKRVVILSGAQRAKSKDLRTELLQVRNQMPGSFDSLTLAQDDSICGKKESVYG